MNTAVTMEPIAEASPRFKARMAGLFWLMTFLAGTLALVLRSRVDASAAMIMTLDIFGSACYVAAAVLIYQLLKPVNKALSMFAALCAFVGCAIGTANILFDLTPTWRSHFTFFGLHCFLVGYLILRSTFMPRIVGALMALGGLGWLMFSFASVLSSPIVRSISPYLMAPGILGEGVLILCLLILGVNVQRWNEQAGVAAARRA